MGRRVAAGLLSLAVAAGVEAQTLPSSPTTVAGRELLAAGNALDAAGAFHRALLGVEPGHFSLRVAVYCDLSNLESHIRVSGNPPELFVLRRSVAGRPCLALYWGLFPSRAAARAALASVPAPLRTPGQSPVAVSEILPPGEPPPLQVAAAPSPAPAPAPPPAVAPVRGEPAPEPRPATVAEAVAPAAPPVVREEPLPPMPVQESEGVRVPAMEVTAAYSALWDDEFSQDGADGFQEAGFLLSLNANLNRSLGVVGEVSGHYGSGEVTDVLGVPLTLDRDLLGVHAGPRYTHRGAGRAEPYVQALAGWTRTGFELAGQREVEDAFSIQPGVGLNLRLSRSVGLGLGADYRLVVGEEESRNELRLHAGLVFGVGDR
jgi:hypothetical protein